jgi:tubulin monoglycylase TTLL3/8
MNGKKNIWILKPSGLSRGRGIELFSSFNEISHHLKSKELQWVIQKYLENPLTYKNRKMDIRQWVLVTDWNPLTVWFFGECYIRLSTNDYSLDNIKNRFAHLTNNSVNKKAENFVQEEGFANQAEFS